MITLSNYYNHKTQTNCDYLFANSNIPMIKAEWQIPDDITENIIKGVLKKRKLNKTAEKTKLHNNIVIRKSDINK